LAGRKYGLKKSVSHCNFCEEKRNVSIFTSVIRHDVQYSQNKTLNDRPSSVDFRGGIDILAGRKYGLKKSVSHYNFCQEKRNVFIFTSVRTIYPQAV